MSGVSTSIKIDLGRVGLRNLENMIAGPKTRARLHEAMGLGVREVTRDYLLAEAAKRHATADRLGAAHSGHLEQAWRAVEGSPVESDANGATLVLNVPGLGRAFHDVTIVPKNAKALTIPVDALAYNRRAMEFDNLFVLKANGKSFLAQRRPEGPLLMYLLVRSVTQQQDRTLLPSDEQWADAAAQAAKAWFEGEQEAEQNT